MTTRSETPEATREGASELSMSMFASLADYRAAISARAGGEPIEPLRQALRFYANGDHFNRADSDAWDTVSDEPPNFWCDEAGTATVEDGSIAAMALRGVLINWNADDGEAPTPIEGEAAAPPIPSGEFERGRLAGIAQERALWELSAAGQEIEAEFSPEGPAVAALRAIEMLLTNLQPHIPQSCHPSGAAFIDNYVDPALDAARKILLTYAKE